MKFFVLLLTFVFFKTAACSQFSYGVQKSIMPFLSNAPKEPILFVAIEKSASIYIGCTLRQGLQRRCYFISNTDGSRMCHIVPEKFLPFVEGSGFTREHLDATPENIALIKQHGLKVIFHVRDLRQRAVSFAYYHHRLVAENNQKVINSHERGGHDVTQWSLDDFIEHFIRVVPNIVERIQGWLDVYHEGTVPMLITTFEEFVDDPTLFFLRILDFYNIPPVTFRMTQVPKDRERNFRLGSKDEWREVLTLEQQEQINSMIPDEFFTFFNWER